MKRINALPILSAIVLSLMFSSCDNKTADDITTVSSETTEQTDADSVYDTQSLAITVLNSVEFPQMIDTVDEQIISDTIGLTLADTESVCIKQQMMSVDLAEIIIVKASDGKLEAVVSELEKRKQALIDTFAFYPNQVASAEATVVGSKGGYAYLICHEEADTAEDALLAVLK